MVDPKTRVIEYYRANVDEEIDKIYRKHLNADED